MYGSSFVAVQDHQHLLTSLVLPMHKTKWVNMTTVGLDFFFFGLNYKKGFVDI